MGAVPRIARISHHMWEEPCLSGTNGSGTVFFSGCSLGCAYCQNYAISAEGIGQEVTRRQLADAYLHLESEGAHNVNLVTAGHFLPDVVRSLEDAKNRGLSVPVVWNSSGYELPDMLRLLDGLVDIYLPDFKYWDPQTASDLSRAPDYREIAQAAVAEMVRQRGEAEFSADGLMKSGVIVRHLVLPGHKSAAREILRDLHERYGERIWISIMSQYTPLRPVPGHPELNRRVTKREYREVVDYAIGLGITQAFIQEGRTASESFIPDFSGKVL